LKPVFGRVIHKILKTPLIDTFGYEVHPTGELIKNKSVQEIEKLKKDIIAWQLKFYASSEASLELYQKFLQKYRIERVAIDFMEKREALFTSPSTPQKIPSPPTPLPIRGEGSIGIDLYYPWALVFT
jgi:hypothetical protein